MATRESIAIREEQAYARIQEATAKLRDQVKGEVPDLDFEELRDFRDGPRIDPLERMAVMMEQTAAVLESLIVEPKKRSAPKKPEPQPDQEPQPGTEPPVATDEGTEVETVPAKDVEPPVPAAPGTDAVVVTESASQEEEPEPEGTRNAFVDDSASGGDAEFNPVQPITRSSTVRTGRKH